MVYLSIHYLKSDECTAGDECKNLTAYVRIDGKWTKIGYFGSECKKFQPYDPEQEKKDLKDKQRVDNLLREVKNIRNS